MANDSEPKTDGSAPINPTPGQAEHLVFTAHGIRTFGQWQERLEQLTRDQDPDVIFYNYKFGYFSSLAFVFPPLRMLATRRFRLELERQMANHPGARVDLVAHSFGTYLVGQSLRRISKECRSRIHTVILAGSVLKPDFPWGKLMDGKSIRRVVNDCGIQDGILILSQIVAIGMAGRVGFNAMTSDRFLNRYFDFGHGGYFRDRGVDSDEFMKERWLPLLTSNTPPPRVDARKPGGFSQGLLLFFLNNIEPIRLLVVASIMAVPLLIFLSLYLDRGHALTEKNEALTKERKALALVDHQLYVTRVRSAYEAWQSGQFARGKELLPSLEDPSHRSTFEASYLRGLLGNPAWLAKAGRYDRAALSPGGKWLAIGDIAGGVTLQSATSGKPWQLRKPVKSDPGAYSSETISSLAFSADGSTLAAGNFQGAIRLWDVATVKEWPIILHQHRRDQPTPKVSRVSSILAPISFNRMILALVFSPDGSSLASSSDQHEIALWDLKEARRGAGAAPPRPEFFVPHLKEPQGPATSPKVTMTSYKAMAPVSTAWSAGNLRFSPDSKWLAGATDDGSVSVWEVAQPHELVGICEAWNHKAGSTDSTPPSRIGSIAFSPDSAHLAVVVNEGSNSYILDCWDQVARKSERKLVRILSGSIRAMAFDPSGDLIFVGEDGSVTLDSNWLERSDTKKPFVTLKGLPSSLFIAEAFFDPTGNALAVPQFDGTVSVWNVASSTGSGRSLTPSGYTWRGLFPWIDFASVVTDQGPSLVALRTATSLTSNTWSVRVFSSEANQIVAHHETTQVNYSMDVHRRLLFSPTGKALAIIEEVKKDVLQLWDDPTSGSPRQVFNHRGTIADMAFSADGKILAVCLEATVLLLRIPGGTEWKSLPVKTSRAVAFSDDGQWLATADLDGNVDVWDVKSGGKISTWDIPRGLPESLGFSPDGAVLAVGGDQEVFLIDPQKGREVAGRLGGLQGQVKSVGFPPGSGHSTIATFDVLAADVLDNPTHPGQKSSAVKLWDIETGLLLLDLGPGSNRLMFSPNGKVLASGRDFWFVDPDQPMTGRLKPP